MKKLLYPLFITLSLSVQSQITFEYSVPSSTGLSKFHTTGLGEKMLLHNGSVDTLTILNSDGSLYRIVSLPMGYQYMGWISDKLFNSDTLLEFMCTTSSNRPYSIINELSQILYTTPDSVYRGPEIFTLNNGFKLSYGTNNYIYKIFSLPGTLPCNQCNFVSGLEEPNSEGISEMKVYPNPFNNSLEITYDFLTRQDNPRLILTDLLGRELKSIPLSNQSDRINLNTSYIPKGTIIVSLLGGQDVISKKVIKID